MRDRPKNRDEDEGHIPLGVRLFTEKAHVKQVAADVQVDQQVAVEHDHVPGEHRYREVEFTDAGYHVPDAIGATEVGDDEANAHKDRGDGQQLADDDDVVHVVVMIQIGGNHHHHASGGEADHEGEVGDVEPP